jgi:hypothetical protein
MSDEEVISIDPSFFQGLTTGQKKTFEQLIQQNSFLRESVGSVEESATDRVAVLNAELEDADNSIDKLEGQVAHLRVEVSRLQVQNEDLLEVVDTATESAKMSMMREVQVNKDAENMIKEKMESMDSRVNQAEFAIEQKYTNLLYEIQDEKESVETRLKEVEAELNSIQVVVQHKTEANSSLTKQVQQLEETKAELEEDIQDMQKEVNTDIIVELKKDLKESLEHNTEFKDAVARIKWRSKEEIDAANDEVTELKQSLATMEQEQQIVSAELVRVMAERDSLEAEIEDARLNYQQIKRHSGDISDLESLSGSIEPPPSPQSISIKCPGPMTPSFKFSTSPRVRSDNRSTLSIDGENSSQVHVPTSIALDDHKAKLTEKQVAVEDVKRKHFLLMEEMENLRKQHTELIENNMLERKNREKLLKAAQREASTFQKESKQYQNHAAELEKELAEYLMFHKRQTEIKDSTVHVHKELAKSRATNADLAKQLVESSKTESVTQQLNKDLQSEVDLLLAEVSSLNNELDAVNSRLREESSDESDDSEEDDEDVDALFCNSFSHSPRNSTGTFKQANKSRNKPSTSTPSPTPVSSSADYDTLKQMYLASALDSLDKQRRESSSSSPFLSNVKPKMRPRKTNTNLNDHYSPSKPDRFSN